ncbi:MAG: tol-pal system protein YbgF [Paracoccaceae bacterium]
MKLRPLIVVTCLLTAPVLGVPVSAQDRGQTLADIRQELTVLFVELQTLKTELNTTGSPNGVVGGSVLERLNALESEVQRLTAQTERLDFRIEAVVRDGTNQIGDLEFRLCELEEACDIATLGDTPRLGGDIAPDNPASPQTVEVQTPAPSGPELAIGEQSDFDAAQQALAEGDFAAAATGFAQFIQNYPGSPLTAQAHLANAEAQEGLGDVREAARAYLAAFTADQLGPTAPGALTNLGVSLGTLGQIDEACVTLREVEKRYPEAEQARADADVALQAIGCD